MNPSLKIVLVLVVVFLLLQIPIFNPEKNYVDADTEVDITDKYEVPMNIQMDLYVACYDCHSNYTEDYWILRTKLRQAFRFHCASDFGSNCATSLRDFGSFCASDFGSFCATSANPGVISVRFAPL